MGSTSSKAGRRIALLALFIVAAFVVRTIVALSLGGETRWFDAKEYHRLAIGLAETWRYSSAEGAPSAFWPPGYPCFLALIYSVFGPSVTAVKVIQAVIGTLTCIVIYLIALRLIDRRAAFLALGISAVYPLTVYTSGTLYPAVLQTFLLACVVFLCLTARRSLSFPSAVAAGACAGCSALVTPSALPAFALATIWMAWPGDPRPSRGGEGQIAGQVRPRAGRRLALALCFLLPLALVVGAWSLRNYRALGQPVAVSTNGGFNFWLGNHPDVDATTGNRMTARMRRELGTIYAQHKNEVDRDSILRKTALDYIAGDPGRFISLSAAKAINLWRLYPRPATEVRPAGGREKILSVLSYGVLLPFGIIWLVRSLRDSEGSRLILVLFVAYTLTHALFISKVRFRVPLDPYLIIYASGALLALFDFVRSGRVRG